MSTLFVSDLDGTLLDRDAQLSARTRAGLTALLDDGMAFTIATARSRVGIAERVDLPLRLPVVCGNGTFVDAWGASGHLHVAGLDRATAEAVWALGKAAGVCVLATTTSEVHGDRFFFPPEPVEPTATFLRDRLAHRDPRTRVVPLTETEAALAADLVTGLVAIDRAERLAPLRSALLEAHGPALTVYLDDDYYQRGYQWLTVHAVAANKGAGVHWLREHHAPETDRLVVFGDQSNDLPMFAIADHAVATGNAAPEVKAAADEVIGEHHEDAVVQWLEADWR